MRLDTLRAMPFASAAEHLAAEFRWLDARLAAHVRRLRAEGRFDDSPLRGLRLEEGPVLAALGPDRAAPSDACRGREVIDGRAAAGPPPPLYRIARAFGLDAFARSALLVAAAPALDARYGAALALAQNDATRHTATPDLLAEMLDPVHRVDRLATFAPGAPLLRLRLLRTAEVPAPLAIRALHVDDRVALALAGSSGGLPPGLDAALLRIDPADEDWAPDLLAVPDGTAPVVVWEADRDSGQRVLAARRAHRAGGDLLIFDPSRLPADSLEAEQVILAFREALLTGAHLHVEAADLAPDGAAAAALCVLADTGSAFTVSAGPDLGYRLARSANVERVVLPPLDATARLAWWRAATPHDPDVARRAWRSRLGPSGIGRCRATDPDAPDRPLPALLRPVHSRWTRDDLVVNDTLARQLDELTAFVRNWPRVLGDWGFGAADPQSRHCLALLSGPSGTGKTMAASVVARAAGLPLYRASLAAIFDKYLGETEKQIDRLFGAAADAGIALLFDEADALFGARTEGGDAHARYANLTVSHLLQRIEDHEGFVALTSNLPRNMDEAFTRRITHSIAFTLPDAAGRLSLWRKAIPPQADIAADLDLPAMAETFELSGGDIRNAALAAAYLAADSDRPIGMRHLLRAVERELAKVGRTPIPADFGRLAEAR